MSALTCSRTHVTTPLRHASTLYTQHYLMASAAVVHNSGAGVRVGHGGTLETSPDGVTPVCGRLLISGATHTPAFHVTPQSSTASAVTTSTASTTEQSIYWFPYWRPKASAAEPGTPLAALCGDLLLDILQFLEPADLARVACTCRGLQLLPWYTSHTTVSIVSTACSCCNVLYCTVLCIRFFRDQSLWHVIYMRAFPGASRDIGKWTHSVFFYCALPANWLTTSSSTHNHNHNHTEAVSNWRAEYKFKLDTKRAERVSANPPTDTNTRCSLIALCFSPPVSGVCVLHHVRRPPCSSSCHSHHIPWV